MQTNTITYRFNTPTIVSEEIDGEAVIVNMQNGSYYSLDGAGAVVWGLIGEGRNADEIIEEVMLRYSGESDRIDNAVRLLIKKFVEEELIVPADASAQSTRRADSIPESTEKRPFDFPNLRKYGDMEELLLLDPVHETELN